MHRVACVDRLVGGALSDLRVEDLLQVRLLIQCLGHLLQRFHARIGGLASYLLDLSVRVPAAASAAESGTLRGAGGLVGDVLNNLMSAVAEGPWLYRGVPSATRRL